jgi:hypothetical protein
MGIGLIVINLIAYFIMLSSSELIGDVSGFPIQNINHLHLAFLMVALTIFLFLFIYFNFLVKIAIRPLMFNNKADFLANRLGGVILTLQILFFIFNLFYGVNVSGSGNKSTNSVLSVFWVFVAPDLLFIIYYGFYRDSKLFKANLTIALISSLARGRGGIILLVLFMELSRLVRHKKISRIKLLTLGGLIILCYPLLNILKFAIRLYLGDGSIGTLDYHFISVFHNSLDGGYFNALITGVEHIVGRLQTISIVSEIYRLSDIIMEGFKNNKFFAFWEEGLHGIIFDRLMGESRNVPLGTFFTEVGNFNWNFVVGDWNTNPGMAGWLLLNPLWSTFFLLYVGFLCFLSIFLIKLIGQTDMSHDVAWFAWAFYLIPGWLSVFFMFIFSLFIFLLIKVLLSSIPPIKISSI